MPLGDIAMAVLFPTCVGMNRPCRNPVQCASPVPHVRGDEPSGAIAAGDYERLFPTCVGMNRAKLMK